MQLQQTPASVNESYAYPYCAIKSVSLALNDLCNASAIIGFVNESHSTSPTYLPLISICYLRVNELVADRSF